MGGGLKAPPAEDAANATLLVTDEDDAPNQEETEAVAAVALELLALAQDELT